MPTILLISNVYLIGFIKNIKNLKNKTSLYKFIKP